MNQLSKEARIEPTHLTKEEAIEFFSELYRGEHHIPDKIKEWGDGFSVDDFASMATFDYSQLTRFVILCHDKCIRGEIRPHTFKTMKVCIWKRQGREGGISSRHPTMETAIETIRQK